MYGQRSFVSLVSSLLSLQRKAIDTPASLIRDGAKATALREVASQRDQFKTLGIMADWDSERHTYRTLGEWHEFISVDAF